MQLKRTQIDVATFIKVKPVKLMRLSITGMLFVLCTLAMQSCYYDKEDYLYPPKGGCGDTLNVSFSGYIMPTLQQNCYGGCHDGATPQSGIPLTTYDEVKAVALDKSRTSAGRLWGAVRHDPEYSAMPQGGAKLPPCDLVKIGSWVNHGAPNN